MCEEAVNFLLLLLLLPCTLQILGPASTPGPWEENSVQSPRRNTLSEPSFLYVGLPHPTSIVLGDLPGCWVSSKKHGLEFGFSLPIHQLDSGWNSVRGDLCHQSLLHRSMGVRDSVSIQGRGWLKPWCSYRPRPSPWLYFYCMGNYWEGQCVYYWILHCLLH